MVPYLLFCILCVLLLPVTGGLAFLLWLAVTAFIVCWSVIRDLARMLYRAWDRATSVSDNE